MSSITIGVIVTICLLILAKNWDKINNLLNKKETKEKVEVSKDTVENVRENRRNTLLKEKEILEKSIIEPQEKIKKIDAELYLLTKN